MPTQDGSQPSWKYPQMTHNYQNIILKKFVSNLVTLNQIKNIDRSYRAMHRQVIVKRQKRKKWRDLESRNVSWETIDAQHHLPWTLPLRSPSTLRYFTIVLSYTTPWVHCESVSAMHHPKKHTQRHRVKVGSLINPSSKRKSQTLKKFRSKMFKSRLIWLFWTDREFEKKKLGEDGRYPI